MRSFVALLRAGPPEEDDEDVSSHARPKRESIDPGLGLGVAALRVCCCC